MSNICQYGQDYCNSKLIFPLSFSVLSNFFSYREHARFTKRCVYGLVSVTLQTQKGGIGAGVYISIIPPPPINIFPSIHYTAYRFLLVPMFTMQLLHFFQLPHPIPPHSFVQNIYPCGGTETQFSSPPL